MNERHGGQQESPIEAQLVAPPISRDQIPPAVVPATVVSVTSTGTGASTGTATELLQSRAAVLAILFFVTGALGIPLLWMNRKFSDSERIVWTIVVTIYTLILIGVVVAIVMWSYRQVFG